MPLTLIVPPKDGGIGDAERVADAQVEAAAGDGERADGVGIARRVQRPAGDGYGGAREKRRRPPRR